MEYLKTSYYWQKRILNLIFNEKWYNKIKLQMIIYDYKLNRPYEMSRLLKEILTTDSVVLDIGANMGHYACRFNRVLEKKGKGNVYCFEPVDANYSALKKIKRTLKLSRVSIYKLGVSNICGTAVINIPIYSNGLVVGTQATLLKKDRINYKTEEIKLTTIDSFCKNNRITKVDFIKCDTEGNEANVLAGGRKTIEKHLPFLSFEMSFKNKELSWLFQLGYELFYYDKQINKLKKLINYQSGNLIMINKKHIKSLDKIIKYA